MVEVNSKEQININELADLIDEGWIFTLASKIRQPIINDPLEDPVVIEEDEEGELSCYSRNADGSLCFQVNFKETWAFYYPESANSYSWPFYVPDSHDAPKDFEDLFYVKSKRYFLKLGSKT